MRVVVTVALLFLALPAYGQNQAAQPVKKSDGDMKQKTPPRHSGEGRVYSKEMDYSIVPPKGWQPNPNAKGGVLAFLGPVGEGNPNVQIAVSEDQGIPLDKLGTKTKEDFAKAFKGWKLIDDGMTTS